MTAATTKPTLSELLGQVGIGAAHLNQALDETGVQPAALTAIATDQQVERAGDPPKSLKGKQLAAFVLTGDKPAPKTSSRRPSSRSTGSQAKADRARQKSAGRVGGAARPKGSPADHGAAELATKAAAAKGAKLSQRVSVKEAARTRKVLADMLREQREQGKLPNAGDELTAGIIPTLLGFTSARAMLGFVDGSTATKDLKPAAKDGAKDLTKRIDSHQVWARKAVAAAYGVMQQLDA